MKTLTPGKALTELAALPGYSMLVARNVLLEATKNPYIVTNDETLFIAYATDEDGERQFLFADVKRTESGITDGAAFAALLHEATALGAVFPGWQRA